MKHAAFFIPLFLPSLLQKYMSLLLKREAILGRLKNSPNSTLKCLHSHMTGLLSLLTAQFGQGGNTIYLFHTEQLLNDHRRQIAAKIK